MPALLYALLLGTLVLSDHCLGDERKVHIVYMGETPRYGVSASSMHFSILEEVLGSSSGVKESLVYSYGRSFNGFAAKLSDEEATRIEGMEGVVSVFPSTMLSIHTTRSWDFMGLPQGTLRYPQEGDVIIGMLDSGIWPESESFNDKDMGPPPAKWKGTCKATNFTCNNKIIGARFYNTLKIYNPTDIKSPRDSEGHGTHTSSTAAGVEVAGTSYYGLAPGTARGAVPHARIAVYKVCWSAGCWSVDILAAIDDAIADGVDILSLSIGGYPAAYFKDAIAIGSFHAMKHGILTSNSAGNSGPWPMTVSNNSPWSLTVAASTIDRKFIAKVVLGNGDTFIGNSINSFVLNSTEYPLIYGGAAPNVSNGASPADSSACLPSGLNSYKVKGKIVLCNAAQDGSGVLMASGAGMIMGDTVFSDFAFSYPLPATLITVEDGARILQYIQSTSNPIATILPGETLDDVMAPTVVSFSSRGPNPITPDILKPDLTAPGADILAAWSPVAPPSIYVNDKQRVSYNFVSGTSMSCPHATGAAAYIKSVHPDWSPAAIKSALMTTAYVMDPRKHNDAEFSYGAGHIDPMKALNPGLVFDATEKDYINFLCSQGYANSTLRSVTGDSSSCPNNTMLGNPWSLNYPSMALAIVDGQRIQGIFPRTVTNVGAPNSTYYATVYAPPPLTVTVSPLVLSFASVGETKSYTVTVTGGVITQLPITSGYILWKDATHVVRTPLVVYTVTSSMKSRYSPMSADVRSSLVSAGVPAPAFSEGSSMYHKNGIFRGD